MRIAFFGSSLVSAYWNGAATYYRGLIRALAERGHETVFFEPDAFERQAHRDIPDPEYATSVVYSAADERSVLAAVRQAHGVDLVVKASGVGVYDELLEEAVLELQDAETLVVYWDVDAPATLDRLRADGSDPFLSLVPQYDIVFTYGGGPPVIKGYTTLGARRCVPVYNALDSSTHHSVEPDPRFEGLLGFLGNRMPDREQRVNEFFFHAAARLPEQPFVLGGNGWDDVAAQHGNVEYVGHVYTRDHNAFNCTPRAVLNINRESMARYGYSPPTRIFEAAGAGACIITDTWEGLDLFLEPGRECLAVESGEDLVDCLLRLDLVDSADMGRRAQERIQDEHTYKHRALQVEKVLMETPVPEAR